MWIFLLSFLATESVRSASISYPPYSSFLTYTPQKSGSVHGYLRYLNNYGDVDQAGYNDPQSVYAIRQVKYVNSAVPTLAMTALKNSQELTKEGEIYLRAASLQQYEDLKNKIDALKAEGKQPSLEKLSKLQTLEKIAFTSDFSLIAELPEVKSTLHDLQTSISGLRQQPVQQTSIQTKNIKQSTGEIKTYVDNTNKPAVVVQETPEQKQAREDHLRIYKEQIAHLKQLELEHQKFTQEANTKSYIPQSANVHKQIDKSLTELEQATQDHLRLWNEAKLRAEQSGKGAQKIADQQQISAMTNSQSIYNLKHMIPSSESLEISKKIEEQNVKASTPTLQHKHLSSDQGKLPEERIQISDRQQVAHTPGEELRIVNEAIIKSQQEQVQQQSINPKEEKGIFSAQLHNLKESSPAINYRAEQSVIEETPEVKKAREEHLRLVQEANLRAQFVEQQELSYKQGSQVPILKSQLETQQQEQTHQSQIAEAVAKAHAADLKKQNLQLSSFPQQQQNSETHASGETTEVQRLREEHLRIFNSIKAHTEQEQAKQSSRTFPHPQSDQNPISDFAIEEERLLELERLREAERLQKERQLLALDRLRETERLAQEKRQMDAELMRLRLEEEQRLQTEYLLEKKRLQQEQEELKRLQSGDYQDIIIQNDSSAKQDQIVIIPSTSIEQSNIQQNIEMVKQQNQQYAKNPFLKVGQVSSESETGKADSVQTSSKSVASLSDNAVPNVRYIQSSHHSDSSKHQYIKDDKVKHSYHDSPGYQTTDTDIALIALEKATNDHFRAHELALEQLRLARIQNPSVKDCN